MTTNERISINIQDNNVRLVRVQVIEMSREEWDNIRRQFAINLLRGVFALTEKFTKMLEY